MTPNRSKKLEDFNPNCTTVIDRYTIVMDGVTKDENNKIKLIDDGRIYDTESKNLIGTFRTKNHPFDGVQFLIRLPFDNHNDLMSLIYQSMDIMSTKIDETGPVEEPTEPIE